MKTQIIIMTLLLAGAAALPVQAHESDQKQEVPGYRPPTEQAAEFVQNVKSSKIAIFPAIVRAVNPKENKVDQEHSTVALERIVKFLGENKLGTAEIVDIRFEVGEPPQRGQFSLFNHTIETIAGQLDSYTGDADYILVLDIIRVRSKAWGIQCYILSRNGENVFSFLLNSHHKPFVNAAIQMNNNSKESQDQLIKECTKLALTSLHQQVCMALQLPLNSAQANIAGHWEGQLRGDDDQSIRVTLDLDKNEKSEWIASMGLPEENMAGLVVQDVTVEGKTVKFLAVELMMNTFDLTLGPEGTLKGTISGSGAQAVEFKRTGEAKVKLITASPAVSQQLEGDWEGTLQTPNRPVLMVFHFKNKPDNTVKATFSTGGGPDVLPLNDVKQTGQKVEFGMKIAHGRFEGTLNEEGTELVGKLIHGEGEGEHVAPLTLRKKQ